MQCRQHICVPRIDHVHRARETNDYQHLSMIMFITMIAFQGFFGRSKRLSEISKNIVKFCTLNNVKLRPFNNK